jgi:hypothetical protein
MYTTWFFLLCLDQRLRCRILSCLHRMPREFSSLTWTWAHNPPSSKRTYPPFPCGKLRTIGIGQSWLGCGSFLQNIKFDLSTSILPTFSSLLPLYPLLININSSAIPRPSWSSMHEQIFSSSSTPSRTRHRLQLTTSHGSPSPAAFSQSNSFTSERPPHQNEGHESWALTFGSKYPQSCDPIDSLVLQRKSNAMMRLRFALFSPRLLNLVA